jgi:hypothetical protein
MRKKSTRTISSIIDTFHTCHFLLVLTLLIIFLNPFYIPNKIEAADRSLRAFLNLFYVTFGIGAGLLKEEFCDLRGAANAMIGVRTTPSPNSVSLPWLPAPEWLSSPPPLGQGRL